MALAPRLFLAMVLLAPPAGACSLVHRPFDQPSWDSALHYVDGEALHRVDGPIDTTLADGFFLSYGEAGDLVLVAGQEGLGGDCSGDGWLRLLRGSTPVWEKAGEARVWNDPGGPIAQHAGAFWRLRGTELVRLPAAVPSDAYVRGWTPQGEPVHRAPGAIVAGAIQVPREDVAGFEIHVARSGQATGIAFTDGTQATLLEVAGGKVRSITWPAGHGHGGLAWADGWYALLGDRVYRVRDGVTDLGVEGVSVGSRGGQAVVFSQEGYTVFEGTSPVAAARRVEGAWAPTAAGRDVSRPVAGAAWSDVEAGVVPPAGPSGSGTLGLAATSLLPALGAVGLALALRRRPS
ncbi:MAG TPA: hypothetical protein VHI93_03085 [Candidatus Thermoplasmatota archaeon]|nr:hypothetical protein [Candidatus Thermoplasmatota archaeon]